MGKIFIFHEINYYKIVELEIKNNNNEQTIINTFHATVLFLYPLKTLENL